MLRRPYSFSCHGIGFALFYLIPFAMGVYYSFMSQSVDGHFVDLDNYVELLGSASFRKAASNTFYFSAVSVPLMVMMSLGLAMLLYKSTYFQKWLRIAYRMLLGSESYPFTYEEDQAKRIDRLNRISDTQTWYYRLQPRRYIRFGVVCCYFIQLAK